MAKVRELGIVKVVYSSGVVETDKGLRTNTEAFVGDRLIQDVDTKVISVAAKKTATKNKSKDENEKEDKFDLDAENKEGGEK